MRKLGAWGLEAALIVGLGAAVALAGDDTDSGPQRPNWRSNTAWNKFGNLFASDNKAASKGDADKKDADTKAADKKADAKEPEQKKDAEKKDAEKKADAGKAEAKGKKDTEPASKSAGSDATAERARLETEFFRRTAACLKLQEIAARTNDAELQRLADQLSERAWETFTQRTAALPSAGAHFDSDEGVLEKYLGDDKDVKLPKAGATATAVHGKDAGSHAAAKEDKR